MMTEATFFVCVSVVQAARGQHQYQDSSQHEILPGISPSVCVCAHVCMYVCEAETFISQQLTLGGVRGDLWPMSVYRVEVC